MSTKNITQLGPREMEFLVRFLSEGRNIFTIDQARQFWNKQGEAKKILHRLVNKGWLKPLEQGKYLIVPLEAGLEREWSEHSFVVAGYLIQPAAIGYWSAMHHWHFTEQIPRTVFVQTTRRKRHPIKQVLGIRYHFINMTDNKFFGLITDWINAKQFKITDREKTIIDMLDRPNLCGGISMVASGIKNALTEIDWSKFLSYLNQFPSKTILKRLGFLVEYLNLDIPDKETNINLWLQQLSSGISLLETGGESQGRIVKRWRIRVNVSGF